MINNGSQLLEAQLAARRTMSISFNMPMRDNMKAACPIGAGVGKISGDEPSKFSHFVAANIASGGT